MRKEGTKALFDHLYGQGVYRMDNEAHAWWATREQLDRLPSRLLADLAEEEGRLTIRPVRSEHEPSKGPSAVAFYRVALDYRLDPRVLTPDEIEGVAWGLSRQKRETLVAIRDAGREGLDAESLRVGRDRSLRSLQGEGLVFETEPPAEHQRAPMLPGRFHLTDAGWRVIAALASEGRDQ